MTHRTARPSNFHRKFIALILATSVAVAGVSAAPARADSQDVGKIIAGLAVLGLIGAAIHDHNKDRHRPPHVTPKPQPKPKPKPLPPSVRRYDLPAQCLRTVRAWGQDRSVLGARCLRHTYRHASDLPDACFVQLDNRHQQVRGYNPVCLQRRGYRLVRG
ncbi:hypothetical protein [Tritonibacter horizontis]|uniref:Uncharacterized protein n=1 Tax=Tritonibacter horizontis TaxID=1768241 RepID=A0A132C368_9RHOB|nr:hypothetical protein [Tritonibacter horizontis]KUP95009.1 hypothetical protein TRIHO_03470 [Tritonibacter horizontis]